MTLEEQLAGWTGSSSTTEQDKQERTERMVRGALTAHEPLDGCRFSVFAKGSYANNTNVRTDSDVDIAVQCHNVCYWEESEPGAHPAGPPYTGPWTPTKLRDEVVLALQAKFPGEVDTSGSTAVQINAESVSSRVDADVVPCFDFKYYFPSGTVREGTKVFRKNGGSIENYPVQHLARGKSKNNATSTRFKKVVRILKRVENLMVDSGDLGEVPSYFVECLVYNCPNSILTRNTWTGSIEGVLSHVFHELEGSEPEAAIDRWLEVNECKYLFSSAQKWNRADGRALAKAAWNYLELGS